MNPMEKLDILGSRIDLPRRAVAIVVVVLIAMSIGSGPARGEDARELLLTYRCYICHADTVTKAGPAYADVAAAYRGDHNAVTRIAAIIRRGQHGSGPWHMPPHPEASAAEARRMARYILSLDSKKNAASPQADGKAEAPAR